MFDSLIGDLITDAFGKGANKVEYHDYYKYRISYITEKGLDLMFLFVTGLTDNFDNIKKELIKCKKEFLNLFEDIIKHKFDAKTFEVFDPTIDSTHRNLRPKISLVGFSGVGKTTITRLIKAEEIPMQHIPTITGDIATIKIGKLHFHLWDFAGQEQFSYLWNNFIKGSDAVLLITDSSLENVEKSKFFLELIKEQAPQAHTAVIGNKQDLDDIIKPEQIEKILGLKTYSMIAKDPGNRDKMIQIIADVLEMSAEVSPLLKPLLDRDNLTEAATKALENADFERAANLFEKISDLCIELGDDSLGREFYEKGQKIKSMLEKVAPSTPPTPKIAKLKKELPFPLPPKLTKAPTIEEKKELPKKPSMPQPPKETIIIEKEQLPDDLPKLDPPLISEKSDHIEKAETRIKAEHTPEPLTTQKEQKLEPEEATFKKIEDSKKEMFEPEVIVHPKIDQEKIGLNLNPEDFMIKQRPKTIINVPKDAKTKLKTSPFAQVTNPMEPKPPSPISPAELEEFKAKKTPKQPKEKGTPLDLKQPEKKIVIALTKEPIKPIISEIPIKLSKPPVPVDPTVIMKPQSKIVPQKPPTVINPAVSPEATSPTEDTAIQKESAINLQQKVDIEKSLMDLRIKKANMSKMALEFDMKELTGEITTEELNEKKKKLKGIGRDIDKQIKELEDLLKG